MGIESSYLSGAKTEKCEADHLLVIPTSKGKAIPLQTWTDPEGSRRLRLPDFKIVGT
jgi:hypothetical protein